MPRSARLSHLHVYGGDIWSGLRVRQMVPSRCAVSRMCVARYLRKKEIDGVRLTFTRCQRRLELMLRLQVLGRDTEAGFRTQGQTARQTRRSLAVGVREG